MRKAGIHGYRSYSKLMWFMVFLPSTLFGQSIVSPAEKKTVLASLATNMLSNQSRIETWSGHYLVTWERFVEEEAGVSKMLHTTGSLSFSLDWKRNKLAITLDQDDANRSLNPKVFVNPSHKTQFVVTNEFLMEFSPDNPQGRIPSLSQVDPTPNNGNKLDSCIVRKLSPEQGKDKPDLKDPRSFFENSSSVRAELLRDWSKLDESKIASRVVIQKRDDAKDRQIVITLRFGGRDNDSNDKASVYAEAVFSSINSNLPVEQTVRFGKNKKSSITCSYRRVGDVFIPATYEERTYRNEHDVLTSVLYSLQDTEVNGLISDSLFSYRYFATKLGDRLYDEAANSLSMFTGDKELISPEEFKAKFADNSGATSQSRRIVIALLGTLLLGVIGYYFYKKS